MPQKELQLSFNEYDPEVDTEKLEVQKEIARRIGFNEYDPEVDTERLRCNRFYVWLVSFNEYDPEVDTESPHLPPPDTLAQIVSMSTIQKWILKGLQSRRYSCRG